MREAVINCEEYRLESCAEALSRKAVLCVSGTMDCYTPRALHCLPLEQAVKDAGIPRELLTCNDIGSAQST